MTGHVFRQKLRTGEKLFGTCITQPSPIWTRIPKDIGLDFVFVDNEHFPYSQCETANLCHIFANQGTVPIVRIQRPVPILASKALDNGALGIIAPYVENVDQVRDLVGAVKYGPLKGDVLMKGLRENEWHSATKAYLDSQNEQRSAIINIESIPAMENLDELAAVPGLDALLIGPHDLTVSMGIPAQYENPDFMKAVETVIATAKRHQIGAGMHTWWNIEQEKAWMEMGLNMLIHSSDFTAAREKLMDDFAVLKGQHGQPRDDVAI